MIFVDETIAGKLCDIGVGEDDLCNPFLDTLIKLDMLLVKGAHLINVLNRQLGFSASSSRKEPTP